jgi:hypothetical protein
MPDGGRLLDATNVSKKFGEFRAVAGADLAVNAADWSERRRQVDVF